MFLYGCVCMGGEGSSVCFQVWQGHWSPLIFRSCWPRTWQFLCFSFTDRLHSDAEKWLPMADHVFLWVAALIHWHGLRFGKGAGWVHAETFQGAGGWLKFAEGVGEARNNIQPCCSLLSQWSTVIKKGALGTSKGLHFQCFGQRGLCSGTLSPRRDWFLIIYPRLVSKCIS